MKARVFNNHHFFSLAFIPKNKMLGGKENGNMGLGYMYKPWNM